MTRHLVASHVAFYGEKLIFIGKMSLRSHPFIFAAHFGGRFIFAAHFKADCGQFTFAADFELNKLE